LSVSLLQLGAGFAFVERQKRITLDGDDYYSDLLFFLGACGGWWLSSLKLRVQPADSGQWKLYLRWARPS